MIAQPPGGGGDPNAARRQNMLAQLLQGSPMPAAQPNAAASLSNGLGAAMQRPEFQKYLQTLFQAAPATQALPLTPGSMTVPGLY